MAEPVILNPNSYANVDTVLRHVKMQITGNRHWTIVGSDGNPYVLGQRLRDEKDDLKHLLLMPGPDHFELNMVKALFKLLWPVGLKALGKLVGYKTEKALEYCHKAGGHHKAWTCYSYFSNLWPSFGCKTSMNSKSQQHTYPLFPPIKPGLKMHQT